MFLNLLYCVHQGKQLDAVPQAEGLEKEIDMARAYRLTQVQTLNGVEGSTTWLVGTRHDCEEKMYSLVGRLVTNTDQGVWYLAGETRSNGVANSYTLERKNRMTLQVDEIFISVDELK